eukprot:m.463455 g.463455  ORF g.463455 m.463455 type:complete len:52 (+) comp23039_c0_seq1:187-342(+)
MSRLSQQIPYSMKLLKPKGAPSAQPTSLVLFKCQILDERFQHDPSPAARQT